MNPAIILAIIQQLLVPEIMDIVRKRQAANQPLDDAAIIAELHSRAATVIAQGEDWLKKNPK